jgi:hypothetical protein
MKNSFFSYATGIFLFTAMCSNAYSQNSKQNTGLFNPSSKEVAYNSDPAITSLPAATADALAGINARAVKNFKKSFKTQNSADWFTIEDGFMAVFTKDAIKTKVFYDKKGRLIGEILSYTEDKLPKEIRHRVKSTYYDYNIIHVHELRADDVTVYLVKIEDKTSFKTIRVQDGEEMTEKDAFEKSK